MVSYFFALSRLLARDRSWIQVELPATSKLLLGGWPSRLPLTVGNASPETVDVSSRVDPPAGWTARTAAGTVASREFRRLVPTVVPPPAGLTVSLDIDVVAGELPVIGGRGVDFVTTPAPALCHMCLDAGPVGAPLFAGYDRLSPPTPGR